MNYERHMGYEGGHGGEQVGPLELNLQTEEWTRALAVAPIYEKTGLVRIRPAVAGEVIRTVLADGTVETENTAGENQVVITASGGEQYISGADKAAKRYAPTDTPGVFKTQGMIRAIDNPTGRSITITAPWGEQQFGDPGCKIAALYFDDEPDVVNADRYIIGAAEFAETYGPRAEAATGRRASIFRSLVALIMRRPQQQA